MTIDTTQLSADILNAIKPVLMTTAPSALALATSESVKLAQTAQTLADLRAKDQITPDQATLLLDMQKHATQAVLYSIQGVSLMVAAQAVNAAVQVIVGAVQKAIGVAA